MSLIALRTERAAHHQRGYRHGFAGEQRQPPRKSTHRSAYMSGYRAGVRARIEQTQGEDRTGLR